MDTGTDVDVDMDADVNVDVDMDVEGVTKAQPINSEKLILHQVTLCSCQNLAPVDTLRHITDDWKHP